MPKMKTKRAAAKRYKLTGKGKVKIKKSGMRHILTKKNPNLKRNKRKIGYVASSDQQLAKRALPYG